MSDLLANSALELSAMLARGDVGPTEVMRATLDRIEARNPALNAIVALRDPADLLAEAARAESAPARGWLHGIPIAIKDLADAEGLPTTMGSPVFADQIATRDALFVRRLREAGAIVIGKTNTPEFGLGSHTYNTVHGATANPYDLGRSCGGSSGGAAVALASGMLAVADGSDMMGSLRNPAAWNNVYGMRPTWGLVPSERDGDTFLHMLSTTGPMARNPADLGALLTTMAGPDPMQPHAPRATALDAIRPAAAGVRIGWLGDWGGALPFEPGILDLCRAALDQIEGLGARIDDVPPPHPREAIWEAWTVLRSWQVGAGLAAIHDDPATRARLKPEALWEIERGLRFSAMDIHRASVLRSRWFEAAARLFETHDALVLPSAQVWPFDLALDWPKEIAGKGMDTYHRWMEVMIAASLLGLPVVNLPIGFGAEGLPMGMQLIGPRGGDRRLLEIAAAWHEATDWPAARPPPSPGGPGP